MLGPPGQGLGRTALGAPSRTRGSRRQFSQEEPRSHCRLRQYRLADLGRAPRLDPCDRQAPSARARVYPLARTACHQALRTNRDGMLYQSRAYCSAIILILETLAQSVAPEDERGTLTCAAQKTRWQPALRRIAFSVGERSIMLSDKSSGRSAN